MYPFRFFISPPLLRFRINVIHLFSPLTTIPQASRRGSPVKSFVRLNEIVVDMHSETLRFPPPPPTGRPRGGPVTKEGTGNLPRRAPRGALRRGGLARF